MSEPASDIHLPTPSVWPFVMGGGVALAALGIPTSYAFCIFGVALLFWGLVGWIRELRHE